MAVAAVVTIAVAVGLTFAARAMQHTLAYHPSRTPLAAAASVLPGADDVTLTTHDGLALRAWFVPPSPGSPARDQAVLFAHGNGGALSGRARLGAELADRGFAVLMLGYRGYSGNPGTPSEDGLVLDALAGQNELAARGFPPERTIYLGESIGTGVVSGLAAQVPPAGLVLRSPFTSFEDVARSLVPLPRPLVRFIIDRNIYPVAEQVAASDVPVTVIHGSADEVVPPGQSDAVAAAARNLFEHLVVEGARHNDALWLGPTVADAVERLGDAVAAG
ncbi:alpha/beta hydrolase [Xylanimonas allomyrinae]|uniref:Alpha/beta hydrolase n=1 Tax=Xylanimonas allomyrinae TaxID=2509459 RepID=A0A4P6EIM1_9MICO|nr:alpha/beta hydrolase [Xylanimonas allomyrinae]QAY62352.1 alpha/beta hydrolase [Xylanimonas allomyrinae]